MTRAGSGTTTAAAPIGARCAKRRRTRRSPAAHSEVSYGGRCYYVNPALRATLCLNTCNHRGTGWHLADISSAADNSFIQTLTSDGSWYWVGLDDTTAEGTFRWKTTGNVPSYTNWDGEPNAAGGAGEDCARYDQASGKWYDELCTNTYDSGARSRRPSCGPIRWSAAAELVKQTPD